MLKRILFFSLLHSDHNFTDSYYGKMICRVYKHIHRNWRYPYPNTTFGVPPLSDIGSMLQMIQGYILSQADPITRQLLWGGSDMDIKWMDEKLNPWCTAVKSCWIACVVIFKGEINERRKKLLAGKHPHENYFIFSHFFILITILQTDTMGN